MDAILEKCPGCVGIADDVAVYGKTEEEHDANLLNIMYVAQQSGLVFNSKKCTIKTDHIPFFGLLYTANGVQPDPDRVKAIDSLPSPINAKQLQEFLGIATYMSPFIPCLSHTSAILRDLLKKDARFEWLPIHETAFQEIKKQISKATALAYFDPTKKSILQVDSSQRGLGAVLIQEGRPIAFASKSLTDTESRYANIERELLAVVFGCERFHMYLYGQPFTVHSDHKPLEMIQLKNLHSAPPRLQRMLLRLQNYQVMIKYQPGKMLLLADSLSRLPITLPGTPINLDVRVNLIHFSSDRLQELKQKTSTDPELGPLRDVIIHGWPDEQRQLPKVLKPYWSFRDELSIEDGAILKGSTQTLIPKTMQPYILKCIHTGHMGRDKCRWRAKASVFWVGMLRDIEQIVASCDVCRSVAASQRHEPLLQKDIPPHAWHTLSADFFHLNGCEFLLVADHYSKYPFVHQMGNTATTAATLKYMKELFASMGVPEVLYTDNGPQFDSYAFKTFAKEWSFCHKTSSPHYPQSNGFAERMVQTVKKTIIKARLEKEDEEFALLCLRSTPVTEKSQSPIEILMGRQIKSNLPAVIRNHHAEREEFQEDLMQRQRQQQLYHDTKAGPPLPSLHPSQQVRVQNKSGCWEPATVLARHEAPRSYMVDLGNGSHLRRNRRHIAEATPASPQLPQDQAVLAPSPLRSATGRSSNCLPTAQSPPQDRQTTRSGRVIKAPNRLTL